MGSPFCSLFARFAKLALFFIGSVILLLVLCSQICAHARGGFPSQFRLRPLRPDFFVFSPGSQFTARSWVDLLTFLVSLVFVVIVQLLEFALACSSLIRGVECYDFCLPP
jgi:hypothetical protein